MASMKVAAKILGSYLLPVPSLYLTGLTNIPNIQKFELPFEEMLMGSLSLAKQQQQKLLLYIGYLGSARQAQILAKAIELYRDIIQEIIVDPVSGDHGRLYVPEEVANQWPHLLRLADWAVPNCTELQYLSTGQMDSSMPATKYIEKFKEKFPHLSFIVTSLPAGQDIGIYLYDQNSEWQMTHRRIEQQLGGSGDLFAAYFIENFWIKELSAKEGVQQSAEKCLETLDKSVNVSSKELLL